VLATSQQYQEMGGTALYGLVSESSINSTLINRRTPYGSMAAATYEVQASSIRQYLERKLRAKAARWIGEGKDDEAVNKALKEFLECTGLDFQLTSNTLSELRPSSTGDLLQRVCEALSQELTTFVDSLDKALKDGKLSDALEFAESLRLCKPNEKLDKCPKELSDAITLGLKTAPTKVGGKKGSQSVVDPVERAKAAAIALVESSGSASVALQFLERVQTRLSQELAELPEPREVVLPPQYDPIELINKYSRREYYFFGKRFNPTEIADIDGVLPMAISYWNYPLIYRELVKLAEGWIAQIEDLRARFGTAAKAGSLLAERFEKQIQQMFAQQKLVKDIDPHKLLFSNPDRPDAHIPDAADMKNFYRRDLHPVMSPNEVEELLPEAVITEDAKQQQVDAAMRDRRRAENELDVSIALRDQLETEILDNNALPFDLVSQHFSLVKVLEAMRPAWTQLLKKKRGDKDAYNNLCEKFHGFFGVKPEEDQGQPRLPEVKELVKAMCASLALGCQAYWQLHKAPDDQEVLVFPPALLRQDAEQVLADIQALAGKHVKIQLPVIQVNAAGSVGNDFVLLALSYEGTYEIERIASLDYWKALPKVARWLERCEDKSGASIFSTEDENKGIGYPDPSFVRNSELAALRWRPWYKEAEAKAIEAMAVSQQNAAAQLAENMAFDATLYALLDPDAPVKAALSKLGKGWKTPLVSESSGEKFTFTRPAYLWEEGEQYSDTACGWKSDQTLAVSICNVVAVLKGEPRKGVSSEKGTAWRERILAEALIFWNEAAEEAEFVRGTRGFKAMLRAFREKLGEHKEDAQEANDRECWSKLVSRLDQLIKG
jgi:hypothetical protein